MFPKSSQLYTAFGKLCAKMNFEEDALKTLTAAIKLDDSNVAALNELAVLHQVFCWFNENKIYQYSIL